MEIVFATHNKNKVAEIQKMVPASIQIRSLTDINCHEDIPETAETLEGNADIKSKYVLTQYQLNCFADDTGLEIEALNGEPGVRSARYADEINKDDQKNIDLVLKKMASTTNRQAQFRTVISLELNGETHQFEGIAKGHIAAERQGEEGFGYDPIFIPEGYEQSFAQMSMAEKNAISHRGKAVQKLIDFLTDLAD